MKKIIFIAAILFVGFSNTQVKAQLRINIASQPVWGPTGYNHVDYYYLPDVESYYNVASRQYMYQNNGQWVSSSNLPSKYANYDVYKGYKVVLNEPKPYLKFQDHKLKYIKFKDLKDQQEYIKNSNDVKYYVVKGHPKYAQNNKYGDKHDGIMGHENNDHSNKGNNNNGFDKDDKDEHEKGNKGKEYNDNDKKGKGKNGKRNDDNEDDDHEKGSKAKGSNDNDQRGNGNNGKGRGKN